MTPIFMHWQGFSPCCKNHMGDYVHVVKNIREGAMSILQKTKYLRILGSLTITMTYVFGVKISIKAVNPEFRISILWKEAASLLQLSLNCFIILLIFSNLWTSLCCFLSQCDIT